MSGEAQAANFIMIVGRWWRLRRGLAPLGTGFLLLASLAAIAQEIPVVVMVMDAGGYGEYLSVIIPGTVGDGYFGTALVTLRPKATGTPPVPIPVVMEKGKGFTILPADFKVSSVTDVELSPELPGAVKLIPLVFVFDSVINFPELLDSIPSELEELRINPFDVRSSLRNAIFSEIFKKCPDIAPYLTGLRIGKLVVSVTGAEAEKIFPVIRPGERAAVWAIVGPFSKVVEIKKVTVVYPIGEGIKVEEVDPEGKKLSEFPLLDPVVVETPLRGTFRLVGCPTVGLSFRVVGDRFIVKASKEGVFLEKDGKLLRELSIKAKKYRYPSDLFGNKEVTVAGGDAANVRLSKLLGLNAKLWKMLSDKLRKVKAEIGGWELPLEQILEAKLADLFFSPGRFPLKVEAFGKRFTVARVIVRAFVDTPEVSILGGDGKPLKKGQPLLPGKAYRVRATSAMADILGRRREFITDVKIKDVKVIPEGAAEVETVSPTEIAVVPRNLVPDATLVVTFKSIFDEVVFRETKTRTVSKILHVRIVTLPSSVEVRIMGKGRPVRSPGVLRVSTSLLGPAGEELGASHEVFVWLVKDGDPIGFGATEGAGRPMTVDVPVPEGASGELKVRAIVRWRKGAASGTLVGESTISVQGSPEGREGVFPEGLEVAPAGSAVKVNLPKPFPEKGRRFFAEADGISATLVYRFPKELKSFGDYTVKWVATSEEGSDLKVTVIAKPLDGKDKVLGSGLPRKGELCFRGSDLGFSVGKICVVAEGGGKGVKVCGGLISVDNAFPRIRVIGPRNYEPFPSGKFVLKLVVRDEDDTLDSLKMGVFLKRGESEWVLSYEGDVPLPTEIPVEVKGASHGEPVWIKVVVEDPKGARTEEHIGPVILADRPPNVPSPVYPKDGGKVFGESGCGEVALEWSCSDPDRDRVFSDLTVSVNGRVISYSGLDVPKAIIRFGGIKRPLHVRWKVIARDEYGAVSKGSEWAFEIFPDMAFVSELGGTKTLVVWHKEPVKVLWFGKDLQPVGEPSSGIGHPPFRFAITGGTCYAVVITREGVKIVNIKGR